jgi:hypothetical protein
MTHQATMNRINALIETSKAQNATIKASCERRQAILSMYSFRKAAR